MKVSSNTCCFFSGGRSVLFVACALTPHFLLWAACGSAHADEPLRFNRDIRPILSEHCFECHGPDNARREGELRLDVEQAATHSAIVPGSASASPVVQRITSDDPDLQMPPASAKKPLSPKQIAMLQQWINEGAAYEQHWSFMPIVRPAIPNGETTASVNPIDAFIKDRLSAAGWQLSPKADRQTLLRRVALDLTGFPPTPEESGAFLSDDAPDAYEKLVDRLLQSKQYGEHMALPWLEAARYADTSGYQADWERYMWPWRNWVIDAFNNNMPFDQFTVEQLAGDMLPNASAGQILATAFNRNHRINDEGGVIAAEYAVEYVVDRIDTTSTVWLGLTMGCCRCHDHKYDPLPQQDFYNMFAVFNNVPEKGKDGRLGYSLPILDFPNPEVAQQLQTLSEQQAALQQGLETSAAASTDELVAWKTKLVEQLSHENATLWNQLKAASVKGTGKVEFQQLEDGSYLRTGPNPATSTYTVVISADELQQVAGKTGITAIRLDALTHDSLTSKSLAKSVNGNFVLTELTTEVLRGKQVQPVALATATADFHQDKYPPSHAIDTDPQTGWAVEGDVRKENRQLVVSLAEPLVPQAGDRLRIQLQHNSKYAAHAIGRFLLSATTFPSPGLNGKPSVPAEVSAAVLAEHPGDKQQSALLAYFQKTSPTFAKQRAELAAVAKQIAAARAKQFVKVMVMNEMETPRETFVLNRGLYDQPDKDRPASADIPAVFGGLGNYSHDRLGLAKWLVSAEQPLMPRVTVNRFWQQFFGQGLVETVEDFGSQGTLPTHPKLLDWLAAEFRDNGWNVKQLVRLIVTSDTYCQASVVSARLLEDDPKNLLLGRASRIRLSGYQLRDQALRASGLLVERLGGPSVKPYQPPGLWAEVSFQDKKRSTDFYVQDHGESLYRRSLYTFWKRSVAPPMLANFDAAGREMCTVRASRTSTPLQALNLMNDVTFIEAARAMAQRMLKDGGTTTTERLSYGLMLVGLEPTSAKLETLQAGLEKYQAYFRTSPAAALEFITNGESAPDDSLNLIELAAMSAVASVILNLDEVIVRQ